MSVDLERGYARPVDTVMRAIEYGAAGINIEDGVAGVLVDTAAQQRLIAEIAAAVKRAVFINVRTDVFLLAGPTSETKSPLEETVARGRGYKSAGADSLFVPGLADPELIGQLVAAVALPVNVRAGPVDVAALARLGVRRISWGSQVAQSTYYWVQQQVGELLRTQGQSGLPAGLDFAPTNAGFASAR